jgi:hypothetical protein
MRQVREKLKTVPKWAWILLAITAFGIFLRTYEFRDWMIFNPDQARDALLVQEMLAGKAWPLLGPQAGSTMFSLGPIFYYFEYASAKVFGGTADKMAYADLLFSILSIPLAYFFFRKFFRERLSLALVFLFTLSFFVVTYSRFAFNPNSIPFFSMLYLLALLGILDAGAKEKLGWASVLGISMGIGFQLHSILFIAMPLLALLSLLYLFVKRRFVWKSVLVALACFLVVNASQLISEARTGGMNMQAFFGDAGKSTGGTGKNLWKNFSSDALCHIEGYTHIVSALGTDDKCDLTKLAGRVEKKGFAFMAGRLAVAAFGSIFTIGGLILFFRYARRETDPRSRRAFVLVAAYSLIVFAILLPVSSSVSTRYFIVVEFLPFLLVGLWIRFFLEKVPRRFAIVLAGTLVAGLAGSNLFTIGNLALLHRNGVAGNDNIAYYGEVEAMSRYILGNADGAKKIELAGRKSYLSRYGKPLEYFGRQVGVEIVKAHSLDTVGASDKLFYVTKRVSQEQNPKEVKKAFVSVQAKNFGNMAVIELSRKP